MGRRFYIFFIVLVILFIPIQLTPQTYYSNPDMVSAIENAVDQAFVGINKNSRITVIHIQASTSDLTTFITSELIHLLVTRGYNVVDRVDIDIIKFEQELQYSGDVDDNTAVSLGKFIGADLVVTGAVTSIETLRRLGLKVIETETTVIRGTAAVTLSDTQQTPITTTRPQVNRVTVFPNKTTVNKGETQQYMAVVSGTSNISQNVTWQLMGAVSRNTSLSSAGLLTVAANETAPTLIITAISTADANKSETATVTIADDAPRVSRVDVFPAMASVAKGNTQQFSVTVSGTNNPSQAVTWSVIGGKSNGTGISTTGLLVVALNETATALTVRATSTTDRSKSGTTTVTFPQPAPTVINITIIPTNTPIVKGQTRQFTATVIGTNNPPQAVTWELSGGAERGTVISSSGLLQVAVNETATALTVRAISTLDTQKSGTATVAVISDTPSVTSVSVTPEIATVTLGSPLQFVATVNGQNNPSQAVTWTVLGGSSNATGITPSGILLVAVNETATALTVQATSTADTSKRGSATVNNTRAPVTAAVTNITISPTATSIVKGSTQQFSATVTGTNNPSQSVTWRLIGAVDSGTSLNSTGLLRVANNEEATTILIIASSVADPTKSETATVTVSDVAPTVSRVDVSPNSASVVKGNTQLFTATINGTNSPSQAVTWAVTGAISSGTGISSNGLLVVAVNETANSLIVFATSTVNPSIKGSATVYLNIPPQRAETPPVSPPASSAAPPNKTLTPKVFAGIGASSFSISDFEAEVTSVTSFNLGASLDIQPPRSNIVWEIGSRFITRGASVQPKQNVGGNYAVPVTGKVSLDYIDLFVKAQPNIPVSPAISLRPFIGFAEGILLNADDEDEDILDRLEPINVSYLLGMDILFENKFFIGLEYNLGMNRLVKNDKNIKGNFTANCFMLNTGLRL